MPIVIALHKWRGVPLDGPNLLKSPLKVSQPQFFSVIESELEPVFIAKLIKGFKFCQLYTSGSSRSLSEILCAEKASYRFIINLHGREFRHESSFTVLQS